MKTLAIAIAAAATLAFTAPTFAASAAPDRIQLAQVDVRIGGGERHGDRHMRRMHREMRVERREGWRHRNSGMNKTVIIKKRGDGSVVRKTIIR